MFAEFEDNPGKLYLLDSAAVLNDEHFSFCPSCEYLTTAKIVMEFKDARSKALIDNALQTGVLRIREPSEPALKKAKETAKELGTKGLSEADLSIAALAIDLKAKNPTTITDDYSLQNILKARGLEFRCSIQEGIKEVKKFKK